MYLKYTTKSLHIQVCRKYLLSCLKSIDIIDFGLFGSPKSGIGHYSDPPTDPKRALATPGEAEDDCSPDSFDFCA